MLPLLAALLLRQDPPVTLHVGDPAPAMTVRTWVKGEPVKRLGHGRVNVVEFWATWCVPCKVTIPALTQLAKKYQGRATFSGISIWEEDAPKNEAYVARVRQYVQKMGAKMAYNVGVDGKAGTMGKKWMLAAGKPDLPIAFVIDQAGKIAFIGHPMDNLDEVVGKVIAGTFDAKAEAARQKHDQALEDRYQNLIVPIQVDIQAKKYAEAIAEIDAAMKEDPSYRPRLAFVRFRTLLSLDEAAGQAYATELSTGIYKDDPDALSSLAWNLSRDDSGIKNLDARLPVRLAEQAVALTHRRNPDILDTLAQAYARAGRLEEAIATARQALALAEKDKSLEPGTKAAIRAHLAALEKRRK